LHAVLDCDTGLPSYAYLTDGKTSDIAPAKTLNYVPGSLLVMDRAYVDFEWLFNLDSTGVFFLTRLKSNQNYEPVQEYHLNPRNTNIDMDQDVKLTRTRAAKGYPKKSRLVHVWNEKKSELSQNYNQ